MTNQPKTWITNDSAYSTPAPHPRCQWLWTDNPDQRCLASVVRGVANEAEVYILADQYVPAIKEFLISNGFKAESKAQIEADYLLVEGN